MKVTDGPGGGAEPAGTKLTVVREGCEVRLVTVGLHRGGASADAAAAVAEEEEEEEDEGGAAVEDVEVQIHVQVPPPPVPEVEAGASIDTGMMRRIPFAVRTSFCSASTAEL